MTYQEIADHLGLGHRQRVAEYKAAGMDVTSLEDAAAWYAEHVKGAPASGSDSDPGAYQRKLVAEARCKEADASIKELKVRVREGELVERDVYKRAATKVFARVRSRLESIPDELAAILPPEVRSQCAADLREAIRLVLIELGSAEALEDE